jgi:hypothetical protein
MYNIIPSMHIETLRPDHPSDLKQRVLGAICTSEDIPSSPGWPSPSLQPFSNPYQSDAKGLVCAALRASFLVNIPITEAPAVQVSNLCPENPPENGPEAGRSPTWAIAIGKDETQYTSDTEPTAECISAQKAASWSYMYRLSLKSVVPGH